MKYFKFVLSVFTISWLLVCYASTTVRARAVDLKIVNAKLVPPGSRKLSDKILKIDTNNEKFLKTEKNVNIPQDAEDLAIVFGVGKLKDFDENFKNALKKQEAQLKLNDLTKKVTKNSAIVLENVSTDKDAPWYNFDKLMIKWDFIEPYYEIFMSAVKNKKLHKGLGIIGSYTISFGSLLKSFVIDILDPLPQYLEEEMNRDKWSFRGLYNAINLYAMIKGAMISHYFNKVQNIATLFYKNAALTKKYLITIISRIQEATLLKPS